MGSHLSKEYRSVVSVGCGDERLTAATYLVIVGQNLRCRIRHSKS